MKTGLLKKNYAEIFVLVTSMIGVLFIANYVIYQYDFNPLNFNAPFSIYYFLRNRTPFFLVENKLFFESSLTLVAVISIFWLSHKSLRKPLLSFFTLLLLHLFAKERLFYFLSIGAFVSWLSFWLTNKNISMKYRRWICYLGAVIPGIGIMTSQSLNIIPTMIYGNMLMSIYSSWKSLNGEGKNYSLFDAILYWFGVPINFFVIPYTHNEFLNSYMKRNSKLIFIRGLKLIFLGLSKILVVYLLCEWMYDSISLTEYTASDLLGSTSSFTFLNILSRAFKIVVLFILIHTGTYQVFQGASCLFGFDVTDQVSQPWLSNSFLDFWKRQSWHARNYMIKHVFLPSYLKFRLPILSIILIWISYAIMKSISIGGIQLYGLRINHPTDIWIINFIKYVVIFAPLSLLEVFMAQKFTSPHFSHLTLKLISIFRYMLFIVTILFAHEIIPSILVGASEQLQNIMLLLF